MVRVVILERKKEICFYQPSEFCSWEGCNYCAGGISPRLADTLRDNGLSLPEELIESRPSEIVVHGDWKSIELTVPEGRVMLSVFRGSRPKGREGRYFNFDSFLLHTAIAEGAQVVSGEATSLDFTPSGRPLLAYRPGTPAGSADTLVLESDFVVFAAGVNQHPGADVSGNPLFQSLTRSIPGFRPPKVRRTVIAELEAKEGKSIAALEGEVHFAQYGSKELPIEMSSLIPKDRWITVALVGKAIDRAPPGELHNLVDRFLSLPHVRRLLPPGTVLRPVCGCHPNMTVGAARRPFTTRVAVTGDMAVSRLYKDGLYSAHVTSTALADCLLHRGIDAASLARWYAPVIRRFHADNRYGRAVFLLSSRVFAHPALSRILYQAVLTERKTKPQISRRLAAVLWRTASGDDSYRSILKAMLHPLSLWLILTGGLLATLRNQFAESLFGLDWHGVGRYPTGVPLEEVARKREELFGLLGIPLPPRPPEMERMYTIRIRAATETIFALLGAFGEPDRRYLTPRFVEVSRIAGTPNQPGMTVRYRIHLRGKKSLSSPREDLRLARPTGDPDTVPPTGGPDTAPRGRLTSFTVRLEHVKPNRYLLYRILDGFGQDGVFAFDIRQAKPGVNLLTVYAGFDFRKGKGPLGKVNSWLLRALFPAFLHDVLWNHSLCVIKTLAENASDPPLDRLPAGP